MRAETHQEFYQPSKPDKEKRDNALGFTNSYEEEVDEDPAEMIENINSMLLECRVILDTDVDAKPSF